MQALQDPGSGLRVYASKPWYAEHLEPIARLVPDLDVALAASYMDVVRARRAGERRLVLAQHGIGQSYSSANPCYPGGSSNAGVGLFLVPNEHAAGRWRGAYPGTPVAVVGCPRLDDLPRREGPAGRTVAVSFHWDTPEARSALPWFRDAVAELSGAFTVIGHGHPRRRDLAAMYAKLGIEHVPSFDDVCRRADAYVADNTSTLYEFAATGRPVVVMNAPSYRRDVEHGLRFWSAAGIGVNVDDPALLAEGVGRALGSRPEDVAGREAALDIVYRYRTGAAQRSAAAIRDWLQ